MRHPWGSGPYNLSGIRLTSSQKDFLADLVIDKKMKSNEVARHFSKSCNSLRYYTFRGRKSSRNYNERGRSKVIDDISDNSIKNKIRLIGSDAIQNLKSIIKDEGTKTFKRKYSNFVNTDKRKSLFISHRSINRYYQFYIDFYMQNLAS